MEMTKRQVSATNLRQHVNNILGMTNNSYDCRGRQYFESATAIVKDHFAKENISFDGWTVSEVPMIDDSGKYPVAIVICLINSAKKIGISLNIGRDGNLYDVNPDELCEIEMSSIAEAINHPSAKY